MTNHSRNMQDAVMEDYLDSLLTEPANADPVSHTTARLLKKAAEQLADESQVEPVDTTIRRAEPTNFEPAQVLQPVDVPVPAESDQTDVHSAASAAGHHAPTNSVLALKDQLEERFQALFFEVAGLTLAVPLITLGGIHQLEKVGPLFGKPAWFKGVMLHRDQKINVVDTAMWVMPEKYDQNMSETLNYQYLIMLGDSLWGLASDKLVNTTTLAKDEVKWRGANSRRPWLAGTVKEKMCALVDVNQLILMLNNGLGSQD